MTTARPFLYKRGDVVTVPFPLSSFVAGGSFKRRPAVVLAAWYLGNPAAPMAIDCMVAMITTQNTPDPYLIPLSEDDISGGRLNDPQSYLRPNYLFSCDERDIIRKIGVLREDVLNEAIRRILSVLDVPRNEPNP